MKIAFIVPAEDIRRNFLYRTGGLFYGHSNSITGPLILGNILKNAGHEVGVYEELERDVNFTKMKDADVIGIYTMTPNAVRAYKLADYFKREWGKRVLIGGMHASVMPEEALEHADQVVVGEAESVIVDVVEGKVKGKIIYSPVIDDLDTIPFPDYSLLKNPCRAANIMTSRGCPYSCSFCSTSRMFSPYRQRSPDSVIEELTLYKEMGFKYVNFQDDNFTANKKRTKEILRKMISYNLIFKESFFFGRTDIAYDEELLDLLRQANLKRVLIGIESLNQDSLDLINKKQNIDDIKRAGDLLAKYNIKLIASLVLGLDNDGKEEIRKAVNFCKKINAYQLQPAILTPYPGTPIYEQFEKERRIITRDWKYFDMTNVVFEPRNLTSWELQKEFFIALKSFYSLPSVFKIFRKFGFDAGIRRTGLWLIMNFAVYNFMKKSKVKDGNLYNWLSELDLFQRYFKKRLPELDIYRFNYSKSTDYTDDSRNASLVVCYFDSRKYNKRKLIESISLPKDITGICLAIKTYGQDEEHNIHFSLKNQDRFEEVNYKKFYKEIDHKNRECNGCVDTIPLEL